ncbi:MAG: sugar phosphate isomerase/epimerase [Pirellulales bacterium]|nr:sugar phosphate isomerase/epimerase [Pirellulales bacterium]
MLKFATKFAPEPEAFETAQRAGFRDAELWLGVETLSRGREVARLASNYALGCNLHFPNRGELDDDALRGAVRLYRDLQCTAMVIHRPMLRRYAERILAHDASIRLGLENHRLDRDQFSRWAEESAWLTLDVEHLWKLTLRDSALGELLEQLDGFLSRYGDKLVHVHLPGYMPGSPEHRPIHRAGDAALPILSMLAAHRFEGMVVSEADPEYQNATDLAQDVLLFERWRESLQSRGI